MLDLRTIDPAAPWLHEPFVLGVLGYTSMRARWDQAFDALVYNRVMEPSVVLPTATDAGAAGADAASDSSR